MLNTFIKKILQIITLPIRYLIRYEMQYFQKRFVQDIGIVLQKRATESTARYIEKNMLDVDSVTSKYDLLEIAFIEANSNNNRLICEFGVYSGKTINFIASLTKQTIYGFDSFEGLPERWRDGFLRGHYRNKTLPKVQSNVVLIKGKFDDTLNEFIQNHNENIGFMHIDCDLYSSTRDIFKILNPKINSGCIIVFDEYFNLMNISTTLIGKMASIKHYKNFYIIKN